MKIAQVRSLIKRGESSWEGLPNTTCKITDLDKNRIDEILRMAIHERRLPESAKSIKVTDVLTKLGLIAEGKLTNAAVILFCKKEDKQFMQSNLKLARFKGTDKTEFLDSKMYRRYAVNTGIL